MERNLNDRDSGRNLVPPSGFSNNELRERGGLTVRDEPGTSPVAKSIGESVALLSDYWLNGRPCGVEERLVTSGCLEKASCCKQPPFNRSSDPKSGGQTVLAFVACERQHDVSVMEGQRHFAIA